MAVERFLEFFAAAIDERPDAGRVWSGGGAVPGVRDEVHPPRFSLFVTMKRSSYDALLTTPSEKES